MLDQFETLLSREAMLGLCAYGGIAYLAAGPISERIAARDHLPLCRAGQLTGEGARRLRSQEDMARDAIIQGLGTLGEAGRVLGQMAETWRRAGEASAAAADAATCDCRMQAALAETRHEWALHVGTLKLYSPPAVATFGAVMARVPAARCGRRA